MYRLINDFGIGVTLRKVATGAYDPSTGSAGNTATDHSVKSYMAQYTLTELTLDTVVRGDRKALLSAFDVSGVPIPAPDEGDLLVGVGDTVRVVSTQTIYSGTSVVCYICQVRE
tara:strand:+ start:2995 stop:3336 length:342 start_codon:yes stop_codon:yes gene_type:complete